MELLHTDGRIAVCIKPAGVLSVDAENGMPALLRRELKTDCFRTVHRLDAAVSGVTVYARSQKAAALLSEQLRNGEFHKEYLAVIHGTPAESEGELRDLLLHDRKTRLTSVVNEPSKDARQAALSYRVLEKEDGMSLLLIRLHTGRTHQIRVQFSSRALPLVGDRKYGNGADDCPIALWSYRLSFRHPQTDEPLTFTKSPPRQYPWTVFNNI